MKRIRFLFFCALFIVQLGMTSKEKLPATFYNTPTLWLKYDQHCKAFTDTIKQHEIFLSTFSLGGLGEYSDSLGYYPYGSLAKDVGSYYALTLDRIYAYDLSTGEDTVIEKRQTVYIPKSEAIRVIPISKIVEHRYIYGFEGKLYRDSLFSEPSNCNMNYCLSSVYRFGNALKVTPSDGDCEQFADSICKQSLWIKWTDGTKLLVKLGR